MKRLIISSGIILLILAVGFFSIWYLEDTKDKTMVYIDAAQEAIDRQNKEEALHSIEELQNFWENHEHYVTLAIRYHDVEEVTKYMAELPSLIEHEEYGASASVLNRIRLTAEHIVDSELPTPLQIF